MPSAWAASSASAISMAKSSRTSRFPSAAADAMLQRHAVQKLHDDEGLPLFFADFVDGADVGMVQGGSGLRFALEAAQAPADLWLHRQEETSGPRSDAARCPRPYRPHPCRRRRVFRGCGSGKSFARRVEKNRAWTRNVIPRPTASQRAPVSPKGFWLICCEASPVRQESFDFRRLRKATRGVRRISHLQRAILGGFLKGCARPDRHFRR